MNMYSKVKLKKMAVTVLHFLKFLLEIPFLYFKETNANWSKLGSVTVNKRPEGTSPEGTALS